MIELVCVMAGRQEEQELSLMYFIVKKCSNKEIFDICFLTKCQGKCILDRKKMSNYPNS